MRATGGAVLAVAEDEIGANMSLLAEHSGVFGEAASGICLGALREALAQGTVSPDDRVVLCVTGDGLKTPGPVADRVASIEIEADADALLEQLGVAVLALLSTSGRVGSQQVPNPYPPSYSTQLGAAPAVETVAAPSAPKIR